MDKLNEILLLIDSFLGSAFWFPYVLLGVGIFFTLYLKFPQIRYFRHAWRVVTGKYTSKDAEGDTTHFQALSTALSGTVGTGNIGGVALALSIGGPAALFWMWMTAFFGMTTKFVEVTLSHKYRVKAEDGTMAGGPMYFMDRRLNMRWLAILFAIATVVCSFGTGNLPQINNIAQGMEATFGVNPMVTGGILAVILALVIIGGIKRIAAITSKVVPFMSVLYIAGALAVIFYNIENVLPSFIAIFQDAFTGSAASGGFLGAAFSYAFTKGVARGLYSNEAGQGSAPIAHASAKGNEPVSEGMVSILEPFIDTIIICTLTGLVILSSGAWKEKYDNYFEGADMHIISGVYTDTSEDNRQAIVAYLNGGESGAQGANGVLRIENGQLQGEYTVLNARSIAEDVEFVVVDPNDSAKKVPFSGVLNVVNGKLKRTVGEGDNAQEVHVHGKSLIHSAQLTTKAFTKGFFGEWGQYIVAIGLLLFAFSTTIAWSYYGDRAMIYLVGESGVLPYRILFVAGFFWASFADTTLIWNLASVAIVIMTLPNLLGILLLHKEMKETVKEYWENFNKNH
ncbi:alanine/glycine:cation symporter family protein [Algicola sagamiensis]|uniref:alanine/glycine:cation symporter family protein n=1 Tax=Algicola sagamiensis TaxID=163869 RepID=UPI00036685CF|nr:AGCS family amino acid carrier protein [Algicola sagamiensis]